MSGLATCDCPPCMIYFTIIYQLTVGENLTFQRGSWWFHLCISVTSNRGSAWDKEQMVPELCGFGASRCPR